MLSSCNNTIPVISYNSILSTVLFISPKYHLISAILLNPGHSDLRAILHIISEDCVMHIIDEMQQIYDTTNIVRDVPNLAKPGLQ